MMVSKRSLSLPSLTMELSNKCLWSTFGVILTIVSSGFYTGSNYVIQTFSLNSIKVLLVRSLLQKAGVVVIWITKIVKKESLIGAEKPTLGQWALIILCGICGNCITLFYTKSLWFLPLGDATIVLHSDVIFTVVFATLLRQSTLTWWKVILLAIIILGEILVVQPEGHFHKIEYYHGLAFGLIAALAFGLGAVLISGPLKGVSIDLILGMGATFGIIMSTCILQNDMLDFLTDNNWELILGSFLACSAYGCVACALKFLPPTAVMSLQSLEILMALGLQSSLQQTIPSFGQFFGAFVVVIGIILIVVESDSTSLNH